MKPPKKIWVIDVEGEGHRPLSNAREAARQAARRRRPRRRQPAGPEPLVRPGPPTSDQHRTHPIIRIVSTYVTGPIVGLLEERSRREAIWVLLGIGALLAGAAGWWWMRRPGTLAWFVEVRYGMAALLVAVAVLSCTTCAAWSRSIHRLGAAGRDLHGCVPRRFRERGSGMLVGLLAPGLGLLLAGHPGRAACAWWNVGMVGLAAWILAHAAWLWRWSRAGHAGALSDDAVEVVLLAAVIAGLVGVLGWIVQALDGVRLASAGRGRGDRVALALLLVLVGFAATFDARATAQLADDVAFSLKLEGLRRAPLYLAHIAARLDPGQPGHALHLAALHADLEQPVLAARERAVLDARWRVYELEARRRRVHRAGNLLGATPLDRPFPTGASAYPD